jgi:UDP-glucuronate 4-epimerase
MRILITGCSGFIGFHLSSFLLKKNYKIYGIDTMNSYYDPSLKYNRLKVLKKYKNFNFYKFDISDKKKLDFFFDKKKINFIINLAAYAGVQYSLINPDLYFKANEIGFYNLLENAKRKKIKRIIFASTSSVAGSNSPEFFKESDKTDFPISLYAATKKNNEILAYFYAINYKIRIIGLRFFTVYGPWGRPDLSIFRFAEAMRRNKVITLNNNGRHYRDFTYIDDVVIAIHKLIKLKNFYKKDEKNNPYYHIFNMGGGQKIQITKIVEILQKLFKKRAIVKLGPLKKGDIIFSRSSTQKLFRNINYIPKTKFSLGVKKFFEWFKIYHNKN